MAFKDRLKKLRSERGITQEDLAQALELPASTIRRYESSDDGMPKHERLQTIADFFGCTVDYLLERTDERYPAINKESELTLPESVYEKIVKQAEAELKVNLRDDPVVEAAVRDLIYNLAKMKAAQKTD